MAPLEDGDGGVEEGEPEGGEEDYADAVTRHAKYLGIDPEADAAYIWIAEEVSTALLVDACCTCLHDSGIIQSSTYSFGRYHRYCVGSG